MDEKRTPDGLEAELRSGPAGAWDRLVGPGQTRIERAGTLAGVIAGGVFGARHLDPAAPLAQRALARIMAIDLWGGVWVNNTRTGVEWYERPGQGAAQHIGFAAQHVLQTALVAWLDSAAGRDKRSAKRWALGHFGWMMASTTAIVTAPRPARLPIAATASAAGLALDERLGRPASAPWFAPAFYAKLLIGHAAGGVWARHGDAVPSTDA